MAKPGPFPFVPNMEDCCKVVKTKGGTCYIMDTICKHMTPEDKARADEEILRVHLNAALKKAEHGSA